MTTGARYGSDMSDDRSETELEPGVVVLGAICAAGLLGLIYWLAAQAA